MKRVLKFLFVVPVLILLFLSTSVMAQPAASRHSNSKPESRPPGGGGSAPIGSGVFLLGAMALGYGIKKIFDARNYSGDKVTSEQSDILS